MYEKTLNTKQIEELYEAILSLNTLIEVKSFMRDIATVSELKALAERFQVAKQVDAGIPYREISKKTGASTATVTRVAHWLHNGLGGYKLVLARLKK